MSVANQKYLPLTCAFGALFLIFPVSSMLWEIYLTELFLLLIVVVAIFTIELNVILRWVGLLLVVPSYVVLFLGYSRFELLAHATAILVYLIAWRAIALDVLYRDEVTMQMVFGAIVVYCLIGVVWGHLYAVVGILGEGVAFTFEGGTTFDYFYFSYASLTTVGYGDVAPVSQLARGFAILEAVLGQIFLAVFIARLIGRLSREPVVRP